MASCCCWPVPSAVKEKRRRGAEPDRLTVAFLRVVVLAPGGFVAGYAVGRALGRLWSGCPVSGPCDEAAPVLLAIPTSLLGLGVGSTLAAMRVARWWEGVAVLSVGVAWLFAFIVLVGWLGVESLAGRLVSVAWLLAATAVTLFTRWPLSTGEDAE